MGRSVSRTIARSIQREDPRVLDAFRAGDFKGNFGEKDQHERRKELDYSSGRWYVDPYTNSDTNVLGWRREGFVIREISIRRTFKGETRKVSFQ